MFEAKQNITVVIDEKNYPCFTIDGVAYHITLGGGDVPHVTNDRREHYYFKTVILPGKPTEIQDDFLRDASGKVIKAPKFSNLPKNVQTFIRAHYTAIMAMKAGESQTFPL